eukprot:4687237-Pleurochrysis_carterae.AAC.1
MNDGIPRLSQPSVAERAASGHQYSRMTDCRILRQATSGHQYSRMTNCLRSRGCSRLDGHARPRWI